VPIEKKWTRQDAIDTYLIDKWGAPYFDINERGHIAFTPAGQAGQVDLRVLVDEVAARGMPTPILVRFNDILKARIHDVHQCFATSIAAAGYRGQYRGVMPIKVNQQRHVVEQVVEHGTPLGLGLEAGSKPELLVAIAMLEGQEAQLVCNGYKDDAYIETALCAAVLGITPFIVLDRFEELELIIAASQRVGIRPHIGVRAKLSSRGAGRWKDSTGDRSKFGLSPAEIIRVVDRLREAQLLDCLQLLHFHIGSQITDISSVKDALREATHLYCHLRDLGATSLDHIDCGGGLAVDYDGSRTNFHSSKNYSTQEYANDVVAIVQGVCDRHHQPHPTLMTESGRALLAQHSVLIFDVVGVHHREALLPSSPAYTPQADEPGLLARMRATYHSVNARNFQTAYNDIAECKEATATQFCHGMMNLRDRAIADDLYWATCRRIQAVIAHADYVPDDLRRLTRDLADTYYCNFSLFQSLPDSWAVGHLFPIMPIHRLLEQPERDATLVDLTCDSDGKIDKFIDLRDVQQTLKLHRPNDAPYYVAAFMVGAYQEILGDLHNLFGDTHAVHVNVAEDGSYRIDHGIVGDTVSDVLEYVAYSPQDLLARVQQKVDQLRAQSPRDEARYVAFMQRYAAGLEGYTYLGDNALRPVL
jgi:arginine decarboxylase